MSIPRKFNFSLSVLNRAAASLQGAIGDPAYAAPMAKRLGAAFAQAFAGQIEAIPGAGAKQREKTVAAADLTDEQKAAFQEMERLTAGARRTAKLAFPGETTRLREEFQVGIDTPKTLDAEVERAGRIHTAAVKYAAELGAKGWIDDDTAALGAAVALLKGKDLAQEEALDDRLDLTDEKIAAANALYHSCLTIQNAARLQYPAKADAESGAQNATARARFLLDEFPPRDRSEPDGGTQGGGPPPPAP